MKSWSSTRARTGVLQRRLTAPATRRSPVKISRRFLSIFAASRQPPLVGTLEEGAFLGQTALTRQPVLAGAYALDEVTVLQIDRAHMEELVLRKPLLLQEIGRAIEDGRANVLRVLAMAGD